MPLQAFEPEITLTTGKAYHTIDQTPAIIENSVGQGRAIYLNLDMHDYIEYRLTPPEGEDYRECFRQLLQKADIEAPVKVINTIDDRPAACVEIWRYRGNEANYVALMRNAEVDADSLGNIGYRENEKLERVAPIQVILTAIPQVNRPPFKEVLYLGGGVRGEALLDQSGSSSNVWRRC